MRLAKFKTDLRFDFLNKSLLLLIGTFIFLNPFPHTTAIKEICFYLSVVIVLILLRSKKNKFSLKTPILLPFGLFAFWAFLSIFFALDKGSSIHDFYAHFLKYVMFYYVLVNFFRSEKHLTVLVWIIIISGTIFSVGALFYFYLILGNPLSTKFGVGFKNSAINIMGFITIFASILSYCRIFTESYLHRKIFLLCSLFFLLAASILTQSRGNIIALVLAFAVLMFKNKKLLICFAGGVLIFIAISPVKSRFAEPEAYEDRIGIIYYSLEIIKDHPIIGTGFAIDTFRDNKLISPEKYKSRIPEKHRSQIFLWPHNMLLSIGVRVGFIGLILFLYLLFVPLKMCVHLIRYGKDDFIKDLGCCILSVFVMFLVKGLFEPIFTHFIDVIFYTILSMVTILWRLNEDMCVPAIVDFNKSDKENK